MLFFPLDDRNIVFIPLILFHVNLHGPLIEGMNLPINTCLWLPTTCGSFIGQRRMSFKAIKAANEWSSPSLRLCYPELPPYGKVKLNFEYLKEPGYGLQIYSKVPKVSSYLQAVLKENQNQFLKYSWHYRSELSLPQDLKISPLSQKSYLAPLDTLIIQDIGKIYINFECRNAHTF